MTDADADARSPAAGGVLVVTGRAPGPHSGYPRDRELFRRILDLAAVVDAPVVVAVVEHGLGDGDTRPLAAAGVPTVLLGADPVAALAAQSRGAAVVWATSVTEAATAQRALDRLGAEAPRLVVDLDHLPSHAVEEATAALRGIKADGHATLVDLHASRERALLGRAAAIVTTSVTTATRLAALVDTVVTVAAVSHEPDEAFRFGQRTRRAMHVGHWLSEPGTPDEDGGGWLLDGIVPGLGDLDVHLVGADVAPRLRNVVEGRATTRNGAQLDDSLRRARVAIVNRRYGTPATALLPVLAAASVPFVATPQAAADAGLPEDLAATLVAADTRSLTVAANRLLDDADHWSSVRDQLLCWIEDRHAPASTRATVAEVLSRLGVPTGPTTRPAVAPRALGERRLDALGTLAGADPDIAEFERRIGPGPLLGRDEAIRAEHPLAPEDRYQLFWGTWNWVRRPPGAYRPDATPVLSILVPTWNSPPTVLVECLESVRAQTDGRWQLVIVDDASSDAATHRVLDKYEQIDPRIVVRRLSENLGIAGASNEALALATGDYVGLLDHDDLLTPHAVELVLRYLEQFPDTDYLYTDEDKLDQWGRRVEPFMKPDWSPDLLLCCNYVTHFSVFRRTLLDDIGGWRLGFDGAQDYDLVLRATERARRIGHVARPLYTWRQVLGSTSEDPTAKPAAHDAGTRALRDALDRRGADAEIVDGLIPTWHRVRYHHDATPRVTVIVPTRDRVELLRPCVERFWETVRYPNVEMLVVDNQSSDPATLAYLSELERTKDHTVVRYPHEFSYARQMNLGAAAASGEVLLLLNNDARPVGDEWFDALLEHALRPEVGAVGAHLRFPDGRSQHEGIVLNVGGCAWNLNSGPHAVWGRNIRNAAGVTAACLMTRTAVYWESGGFDERLRVTFNDVDFCIRVGELGYRILYTPYSVLDHPESASRGSLHPMDDENWFIERWGPRYGVRDPFYNHQLDLMEPLIFRV